MRQHRRRINRNNVLADGEREGSPGLNQWDRASEVPNAEGVVWRGLLLEMLGLGCSRTSEGLADGSFSWARDSPGSMSTEVVGGVEVVGEIVQGVSRELGETPSSGPGGLLTSRGV